MKKAIILLVFISTGVFAQDAKRGTVKVKKAVEEREKVVLFDTLSYMRSYANPWVINNFIPRPVDPKYVGGELEMNKFINANIKCPDIARYKGMNFASVVGFNVELDGTISDVKALKQTWEGGCDECDVEAERIVKLMPKWTPGMIDSVNAKLPAVVTVRFKYLK